MMLMRRHSEFNQESEDMKEGIVIYEFCDDNMNTYQIIDWEHYVEVSLVLVNVDKRTLRLSR